MPINYKKNLTQKVQNHINRLVRERTIAEQPLAWGGENFVCCSCGQQKSIKSLQAGHFYSVRQASFLRFHPWNINGECAGCNCFDNDHLIGYSYFMRRRYGDSGLAILKEMRGWGGERYKKEVKPHLEAMLEWNLDQIFDNIFKQYHGK